jgi:cytochrome c oxidase cbb3-type subunit 3
VTRWRRQALATCIAIAWAAAPAGCRRELRELQVPAADRTRIAGPRLSDVQPGPTLLPAGPGPTTKDVRSPAEGNAFAISEGQRLYTWYNCSGCHSNGGGGMGPALMDDKWLYGSAPAEIYRTIVEGRPGGMPSFGGHIPVYQIWQLVAYVRSLSGLESQAATPPRTDQMQPRRGDPAQ